MITEKCQASKECEIPRELEILTKVQDLLRQKILLLESRLVSVSRLASPTPGNKNLEPPRPQQTDIGKKLDDASRMSESSCDIIDSIVERLEI